jgi:signal transduction histidine kinase
MTSPFQSLIMIVDDNPTNVKVLFDFLRETGFRVLVAQDGESALEKLEQVCPDLILLDVMMPGIDGFETCRRLKAIETTQKIPIIFMTALSDSVDKIKGLKLGAVDYITKPFQHEEVLARINHHLKVHHLTQTLEQSVAERTAALADALEKLQHSQLQVVQNEKMSALGQLVAGVAHEINNPVGCVSGNLVHAQQYMHDLIDLLSLYQQHYPQPIGEILQKAEEIDLDYLREDLPRLMTVMKEGVGRIRKISTSLRTFSRTDSDQPTPFNIHDGIDSTLMILGYRLKASPDHPEIEVVKQYGQLPEIEGFPGEINQVLMNLLANAIDALEEAHQNRGFDAMRAHSSQIRIQTRQVNAQSIEIRIRDNGMGMSDEVQKRAFEYAFTTKPMGKGTGLGLAISRSIVTEKHGGQLMCQSRLGEGTETTIVLPLRQPTRELVRLS